MAPSSDALTIGVLGTVQISVGGKIIPVTGKMAAILAILVMQPDRRCSREKLATMLWGDSAEEQARHNLRQTLTRIRKSALSPFLDIGEHFISCRSDGMTCDLWTLQNALASQSTAEMAQAVKLYRGLFAADQNHTDAAFNEWLHAQRMHADRIMVDLCVALSESFMRSGQAAAALPLAHQAIAIDAFREDAHRLVMRAYLASDRRTEALRHYDDLSRFLDNELDTEPDELTQMLAVSLKQESSVTSDVAAAGAIGAADGDLEQITRQALKTDIPAIVAIDFKMRPPASEMRAAVAALAHEHGAIEAMDAGLAFLFPAVTSALAYGIKLRAQLIGQSSVDLNQAGLGLHVVNRSDRAAAFQAAQRLSRMAQPMQFLLSAEARAYVVDMLDVAIYDLGEQSVIPQARDVTARIYSAQEPPDFPAIPQEPLLPMVAVIPFATHCNESRTSFFGDLLADDLIGALSQSFEISVISRLSTAALRARALTPTQIHQKTGASFVLAGNCYIHGNRFSLIAEFADTRSGEVIWMETVSGTMSDPLVGTAATEILAGRIKETVMLKELRRLRHASTIGMHDGPLLLGAISLMHQISPAAFGRSRELLNVIVERAPHCAAPRAWLGMHCLLRVSQGWSHNVLADAQEAIQHADRALEIEPENSLALAVNAHVHTQLKKDLAQARHYFDLSLRYNPSNSLAWLLKSTLHAFQGEGPEAVSASTKAMRLSPLDPRYWFYESLSASAAVGAEDYSRAITLARRSIQANAGHASTYRALAIAQYCSGQVEEARQTVSALLKLQPALTVRAFLDRHPSGASNMARHWADALRRAGVPE